MSKTTLMREWAESVMNSPIGSREEAEVLAAEHVLATTTEPTMTDVKWSDEKHFLAGATSRGGDEVVMMWNDVDETKQIICHDSAWEPDRLTPNGKRYELVEVTGDEHPETLRTVEDYENAPEGTIVAMPTVADVWVKAGGTWKQGEYKYRRSGYLAGTELIVLRWGWGE